MREKIAEIICPDCQDKKEDGSCIWKNCSMYDKKQALEALFIAEQKQWEEDLIDYLNYRLSEYTKKEHLFETIKKWRD